MVKYPGGCLGTGHELWDAGVLGLFIEDRRAHTRGRTLGGVRSAGKGLHLVHELTTQCFIDKQ